MSTFDTVTENLGRAWDNLAEGWRELRTRAGSAITRFNPLARRGTLETAEEQIMQRAPRWGFMAADVRETATEVHVRIEAPGMEADQFDLSVDHGVLRVRGEKHVQRESQEGRFRVLECAYGSFERTIALPAEVDDSRAKARYRRGVLEVTLPRTRAAGRNRIDVQG
ncbi:MAG: Hsp20/alpha crystallin family protein [Thiohalobacteraceae bacterium]